MNEVVWTAVMASVFLLVGVVVAVIGVFVGWKILALGAVLEIGGVGWTLLSLREE